MKGRCWLGRIGSLLPGSVLLLGLAGPALAEDPTETFDEPAATTSKLTLSANTTFATDYIFRGISQTDENPTAQGGFELEYNIFYLGIWGSNVDFGTDQNRPVANVEVDWYGGIRPEWKGISFDLGVFYYTYPGGLASWKLDYVEFGTAASYTLFDKLTLGVTNWWTPENSGGTGYNDVVEGSASYAFNKVWMFSPSVSTLIGRQWGEHSAGGYDYTYWNAGLSLDFTQGPAFTLDVRYWDTNIPGCASADIFQCDERVVGSLTAVF